MPSSSIRILVTGGTFDKEYDEISGQFCFGATHVPEMLRLGRCLLDVEVETILMIDSLEMTADQRQRLARRCAECDETRIVVTHGTDTMVESAALLARQIRGKTVVVTGAMVPYKFGSSDGFFNLGAALSFVQTLSEGVWIAMNGRVFPWDRVKKNREKGVFEEHDSNSPE